jgi:hypothetical protein
MKYNCYILQIQVSNKFIGSFKNYQKTQLIIQEIIQVPLCCHKIKLNNILDYNQLAIWSTKISLYQIF